tara:strand:- start:303 stop:611 length:309 start_codon:yes stop_codon:yes gene_type:complete
MSEYPEHRDPKAVAANAEKIAKQALEATETLRKEYTQALERSTALETQAVNLRAIANKSKYWTVKIDGVVYFENTSLEKCAYWVNNVGYYEGLITITQEVSV